jgi:hypothetical protein
MFARQLLALSPLAIVAICATVALLARLAHAVWASALIMCSLVWAFALYSVAQKVLNERPGFGRITFPIAIALIGAATVVPQVYGAPRDDPMSFVGPVGMIHVMVSLGFSMSALLRTEGRIGWVFTETSALAIFVMAFLPLGIWFLRPRIEELLQRAAP